MTGEFGDFSDLFDLEAEPVTVGKHTIMVSPLTAADVKYARKAIQLKQITADESESFLAWLSIKKLQPAIKWKEFNDKWLPKWQNIVLAKVIVMNGFLEVRDAIDGKPDPGPDESVNTGLDFE